MKYSLADRILGHNQIFLSGVIGCHFTVFSRKINGHIAFSDEQVHRLAEYFDTSDKEIREAIKEVREIKQQKAVS